MVKTLGFLFAALSVILACVGCAAPSQPDTAVIQTEVARALAVERTAMALTPTATAYPTYTLQPTWTLPPTATATSTATAEPTATSTMTSTSTPTDSPTATSSPAAMGTPTEAPTPLPARRPETVLYVSNEASEDDLYTVDGAGGNQKRLTTIGKIGAAQFSADGRQIVFSRREADAPTFECDIYVMNSDGSGMVNLTQSRDWHEAEPDLSPDGTRIVFRARPVNEENSMVYLMNADGTGKTLISDVNETNLSPTWSPDGQRIAFMAYWNGQGLFWRDKGDIFVMNPDGSGLTNLTNIGEHFSRPIWSPDGAEIAYGRLTRDPSRGESWQVWRMNADGTDQRCILGCTGEFAQFSVVPAAWLANRIAFRGYQGGDWDVFLANTDGSGITRLTDKDADEKTTDWHR